jgi:hypothetical protein
MTMHLSAQEFVDAVDRVLPPDRLAHLTECESCHTEADAVRAVITEVGVDAEVPEPSPLFWDHFQARVHAAVQAEAETTVVSPGWALLGSVRNAWAAAAAVALTVAGLAVFMNTPAWLEAPPVSVDAELLDTAGLTEGATEIGRVEWEFVTSVMGDLGQDDAREVLAPSRHAVDTAFGTLTTAEQEAFMKLLKAEMVAGTE